jgi:hypothetical protein
MAQAEVYPKRGIERPVSDPPFLFVTETLDRLKYRTLSDRLISSWLNGLTDWTMLLLHHNRTQLLTDLCAAPSKSIVTGSFRYYVPMNWIAILFTWCFLFFWSHLSVFFTHSFESYTYSVIKSNFLYLRVLWWFKWSKGIQVVLVPGY